MKRIHVCVYRSVIYNSQIGNNISLLKNSVIVLFITHQESENELWN